MTLVYSDLYCLSFPCSQKVAPPSPSPRSLSRSSQTSVEGAARFLHLWLRPALELHAVQATAVVVHLIRVVLVDFKRKLVVLELSLGAQF